MNKHTNRHILRSIFLLSIICFVIRLCPAMASADAVPKLSDQSFSEAFIELTAQHNLSATPQQAANNPYITARLIVKSSDARLDPDKYGAVGAIQSSDGVYILQFDSSEKARAAKKLLEKLPTTEYVEPDSMIFIADEPGDTETDVTPEEEAYRKWSKEQMMFPAYTQYLMDQQLNTHKVVAVLDTGISFTHPLLTDRILKDKAKSFSTNYYSEEDSLYDPDESKVEPERRSTHGTHVAGIVAQCTDGLAVDILPVRVLDAMGNGSITSLVEGIKYAVAQGADVINLSLGGFGPRSEYLEECVHEAVLKGVVVVSCSGNQGREIETESSDTVFIPGYIGECIVVGSVNREKRYALKSNYGEKVDVVAPGVDIWSSVITETGNTMGYDSGTSQAAPHVSSLAALLRMSYSDSSPTQIENLIRTNAENLGTDLHYGFGFAYFGKWLQRTVTFKPGEHGRFKAKSLTALYGSATPTAPDPTGEKGYVFDGWTPSISPTVRDNVTYTAKWKKDTSSSQSPESSEDVKPPYKNSRPRANVRYIVSLKMKQRTKKLKVIGLKDGDQVVSWKSSNKARATVKGKPDGSCIIKAGSRAGTVKIIAKTASGRRVVFRLKIQKRYPPG